jgi:hypothetical protein
MAKPAPKVEAPKVEPAPQVEAATAAAAKPRAAPVADVAPMVEPAAADPPPIDDGSFGPIPTKRSNNVAKATQNSMPTTIALREEDDQPTHNSLSINKLRTVHIITFESPAGVIIGPAQKDICQKLCPCLGERSYISYGEIQRYILLTDHNTLFVYADSTDPSPLYTIPCIGLIPQIEGVHHRDVNSTTISPGTEGTNMRMNSLETVLLYDRNGKIQLQFAFDTTNEDGGTGTSAGGKGISERFVAAILSSQGK